VEYSSDLNLELLLATQTWRYGIFDLPTLRELQNTYFEMTDEQKSQVDNLLGAQLYGSSDFEMMEMMEDGNGPVRRNNAGGGDGATDESSASGESV